MSEAREELYNDAVKLILKEKRASFTFLQRRLNLSFAIASQLIDKMESDGIIGPYNGSKPRKIFLEQEGK